jgi:hypothetical protein
MLRTIRSGSLGRSPMHFRGLKLRAICSATAMRCMVGRSHDASNSRGIRDQPTAPQSSWQNGYVVRLIGSIRRECLDHVVPLGEAHLRQSLRLLLRKDAPIHRPNRGFGLIISVPSSAPGTINTAGCSFR